MLCSGVISGTRLPGFDLQLGRGLRSSREDRAHLVHTWNTASPLCTSYYAEQGFFPAVASSVLSEA